MADTTPPALILLRPRNGASDVLANSNILLEIWDTDTGVDLSSVVITINGVVAWAGDTQQTGFIVTKAVIPVGGIRYDINPDSDFPYSSMVVVLVEADDLETTPNSMREQCEFFTGAWA